MAAIASDLDTINNSLRVITNWTIFAAMKKLQWSMITLVLVVVGLVSGLLFGVLGDLLGLSPSMKSGGIGISVGAVASFLIIQRRAAITEQNNR